MLVLQRLCILLSWSLVVFVAAGLVDFVLRLPDTARMVQFVVMLVLLLIVFWRYIRPAILFSPSLTVVALRVEQQIPTLRGHLASGLEFAQCGIDHQSTLAARAVEDAGRRAQQANLREVIQSKRTTTDLGVSVLILILVGTICLFAPSHAAIAARRMFIPFSGTQWPKRTGVESMVRRPVVPTGRALNLSCRITKGFSEDMRVFAHYRIIGSDHETGGAGGQFEKVLLTHQRGEEFDRLIEPDGRFIELWFETDDDRTPIQRVQLVPPPEIISAQLHIEPPDYARGVNGSLNLDIGSGGIDRSAQAQPVLEGSKIQLTLQINKPIALTGGERPWRERLGIEAIGNSIEDSDMRIRAVPSGERASRNWIVEWTMAQSIRMNPVLVDEYDIYGPDDVHYRIDMLEDHAPTISILDPIADRAVLTTAQIAVSAEARDDVQIGGLRIEAEIQSVDSNAAADNGNDGSATEPPTVIVEQSGTGRLETISKNLAIAELSVEPGDLVSLYAAASDTFVLGSRRHEEVRSTPRRLRIISESEFVEQVYRDLSAVRDRVIEIDEDQRDMRAKLGEARSSPSDESGRPVPTIKARDRRDQAKLSERISRQREQLQDIAQRLQENQFKDSELESAIDRSLDTADQAGRRSEQAASDLAEAERLQKDRMESAQPEQESPDEKTARDSVDADQEQTEKALGELIDLLDRGEDAWGARRGIERLLENQKRLNQKTGEQAKKTRGRTMDELTDEERDQLNELAQSQQELSREAQSLIDDLRNRAHSAEEKHPDLADSMKKAAKQAEEENLENKMKQASQDLAQNQGSRAEAGQQSAMSTLQSMLDRLADTEKARLQRLGRQLASLLESIKGLIADQETALVNITKDRAGAKAEALSVEMIRLIRNTYSVVDFAKKANRQFETVATRLNDAAGAQENAVAALRSNPVRREDVKGQEEESLAFLNEALDLVEQMQKKNEEEMAQKKRQELQQAYRALFDRQTAFINRTRPFIGEVSDNDRLSRRERSQARNFANEQAEIQLAVALLAEKTQEIADSIVFSASHDQIDISAQTIVESYRGGNVNPAVLMRETEIARLLEALALALEASESDDSEFADGESGGGGGGGGNPGGGPQPLIPPAAQLKLLKGLQDSIYRSTRELDETPGLSDDLQGRRAGEIGESQRRVVDIARQVIKQMQQQPQQGPPPVSDDKNQDQNQNDPGNEENDEGRN